MAGKRDAAKKSVATTLDEIKSKDDITLENVYMLGLEHNLENLTPEMNPQERDRMHKAQEKDKQ